MNYCRKLTSALLSAFSLVACLAFADAPAGLRPAPLPEGAPSDPWSLDDAYVAKTTERTRWCLNGLWGFRPPLLGDAPDVVPADGWGWAKIPSVWDMSESWTNAIPKWRKKWQDVFFSPDIAKNPGLVAPDARAWYVRTFTMPAETAGRRVMLTFTMLNTHAVVYVDGTRAAEASFPGGEADITDFVKPGATQTIALDVTAYPLSKETTNFNAPDRSATTKTVVKLQGVTGDLFLDALPAGTAIAAATVECDVAAGSATFVAELDGAAPAGCSLVARLRAPNGKISEFRGPSSGPAQHDECGPAQHDECGPAQHDECGPAQHDGCGPAQHDECGPSGRTPTRLSFTTKLDRPALWDVNTPGNLYECTLSLLDANGKVLDTALPFAFGFRDVRLSGRDILLNGIPIHLRACNVGAIGSYAGGACAETARETIARLKSNGFNFAIMDNYNFRPGNISYMDALLEECDRAGFLISFSLPHVRDFGEETHSTVKMDNPQNQANYRALAQWAIRRARNHPCVIAWAMNHNFGGYAGDMNPMRIDGRYRIKRIEEDGPTWWCTRNQANCHAAWKIAKSLDCTRPVYHHESGNLDEFHTTNIYLNWAPVQERSDWLRHWSETGEKPLFFVEWGLPHVASWSSHRGPSFIHSAYEFQSMWISEFAAAFRGDAAYEGDTASNVRALALEESLWAEGEPFRFYRIRPALDSFSENYSGIVRHFMSDNWRCHRAWGISAMVPWDQGRFYEGNSEKRENPSRWNDLKRPGIVPDRFLPGNWISGLGDRAEFTRTPIGETVARWNRDDCAFIGGHGVFTDKAHHFRPGEKVRKTLVILNDRRQEQTVRWECVLVETGQKRSGKLRVKPGTRRDVPVSFRLPKGKPGRYTLSATFTFEGGSVQTDTFALEAYAPAPRAKVDGLALYDPKGLTSREFRRLGIHHEKFERIEDAIAKGAPLVIGRECLTSNMLYAAIAPYAQSGGRVLVFEQTKETLDSIGFRAQTYGLRDAFPRSREASAVLGLDADALRDWNGESTIAPPHLENLAEYEMQRPTDTWAGFENYRVWRCGNRGCVATALPEKPTMGDWMPLADGGFDLQYSPLIEWRLHGAAGKDGGAIMFCQMDVTARTAYDPVADDLLNRLVARLSARVIGPAGLARDCKGLVFHHGDAQPETLRADVNAGANVLCVGFTRDEVAAWSPTTFAMASTNHCYAARIGVIHPLLDGLSNAEFQWHGSMAFDAFLEPAQDGNAAIRIVPWGQGHYIFWQTPPDTIDEKARPYLRTSKRRAQFMLSRILGNIGVDGDGQTNRIAYADVPEANDDPYRYYRW